MKKITAIIIAFAFICATLCSCSVDKEKEELYIFAASSLTDCLSEIEDIYEAENPDIDLIFNFNSSGTLREQIDEGAQCDVFISASSTPLEKLDCTSRYKIDLLENKATLVVSESNPAKIQSFEDLFNKLYNAEILLGIGNTDVPIGEYTLQIFDYYNIDVSKLNEKGVITYGSSAKEITSQVKEGLVDCAIIYETDAKIADLEIVEIADKGQCSKIIYPSSVLDISNNFDLSVAFLDFLQTSYAKMIFKKYGFTPID